MKNTIPNWLVEQYNYAKKQGWIDYYRRAASKYGFSVEDLLAKDSRESNLKNIKGDFHDGVYHGYSVAQLDINSHRKWIESGRWKNVDEAVLKGAEALAEKRDLIVAASKKPFAIIKFRSGKTVKFATKPFNDAELRQMTIAAYNCGMAAYYHFCKGNDIDAGTTGKNYSRDVLGRSEDFRDLMARDAFGKTANDREISTAPTADPVPQAEQAQFPFGTIEEKYERHADLIQSESTKTIARKSFTRLGSGLGVVWGTTTGKVALVLTGVVIVGTLGYTIYKYRHQIKAFFSQLKDYIKGKF